jgi:colanic acid/amylovoran biosynthesis glycosyltransferase
VRVAFFVSSFPELSETFILRQVTGLLARGHEIVVFAAQAASDVPTAVPDAAPLRSLVRVLGAPGDGVSAPGASLRGLASAARAVRRDDARALGGWRAAAGTAARLAAEAPFDVVHCHYGNVGLRYRMAARLWRAPLIASFYGYDCSSYPRARGDRVYEPLFREAHAVASLSGHMDDRLLRLGCPQRLLRRVPLSVDPAEFHAGARGSRRQGADARVLTVARLTEKKGIEYALRALAALAGEFSGVRYDVIGDGPLRDALVALAAALGLGDRVRFLGARPGDAVRAAMRDADLFVLPSVTAADGDEEGTPTVLLEAAFCELPVLSTRHAGIPELVREGESGYLVPERDVDALADGLRTLLRAPERWAAMGAAGRRLVERDHTTAAVAARLDALYRELTTAAPAPSPA